MIIGGSETVCLMGLFTAAIVLTGFQTMSALMTLVLAMLMHPDVQKKAQEELDIIVGPDRLPQSDDRPSLPYIEAMVREGFRWQPVGPLGVPHISVADDEYRGYSIPKGTPVLANTW